MKIAMSTSLVQLFLTIRIALAKISDAEQDDVQQRRILAKPWYMRNIQIGTTSLPISPVTVAVVFLSIFYLLYNWNGKPIYCEASHILLMDHTDEAETKLQAYKEKIDNNEEIFAKHASKYSACPSKSQGGKLGRFPPHAMTPPFDRVCFDPQTPLKTTIGPIHTQFGWHLIYIHDRQLNKD